MREKRRVSSARNTPRSNDILRPQRSALEEACPDLAGFEVEGAAETVKQAYSQAEWSEIENAPQLRDGAFLTSQALALPMRYAAARSAVWHRALGGLAGAMSCGFGAFLVYQIGFVEKLFLTGP